MPSSPNGPCSTGNTTSTPSRPPTGRHRHLGAVAAPHPVAPDLDRDRPRGRLRAVPRGPTPRRQATPRARRSGPRRAPQHERASLLLLGVEVVPVGVVGVVVLVVVVGVGATYLPTTIVTLVPFLAWVAAAGVWLRTTPFWLWFGHRLRLHGGREAGGAERGLGRAASSCRPRWERSRSAGALATTRVTVEPVAAAFPPPGSG